MQSLFLIHQSRFPWDFPSPRRVTHSLLSLLQDDVFWLKVPMDDSVFMKVSKCRGWEGGKGRAFSLSLQKEFSLQNRLCCEKWILRVPDPQSDSQCTGMVEGWSWTDATQVKWRGPGYVSRTCTTRIWLFHVASNPWGHILQSKLA